MLSQTIYLAVALFYQKRNPSLGLQILTEKWPESHLPEDFLLWWQSRQNYLLDQCSLYVERGVRFTFPGCHDYPRALLKNLEEIPLLLSYKGRPRWNDSFHLAIVGSRKMNVLTQDWLNLELVPLLRDHSLTIVSGGARGVDQAAHLCALRSRRPTYIFLPSGLERIYPRDLARWEESVIEGGGALVSEYWPDVEIKKHFFIQRNRLIAALSDFVLVVQAERRSGTLLTAQWAIDLGRELGVLPGHPMDSSFSGNLELLRNGIHPVIDRHDLLALLQPALPGMALESSDCEQTKNEVGGPNENSHGPLS